MSTDSPSPIRRLLLAVIVIALLGMAVDLLLLAHYEDSSQLVPLFLIVLTLAAIVAYGVTGSAGSVRLLQATMVLCMAGGLMGIALHYQGGVAFQLELNPTAGGRDLFSTVVRATTPPVLAPAALVQLGLLGLVFSYRHPALRQTRLFEADRPDDADAAR